MISTIRNNIIPNRPAFGAAYISTQSSMLGEIVRSEKLPENQEITQLTKLENNAKNEWKYTHTDTRAKQSFYHFTSKDGYSVELQPNRNINYGDQVAGIRFQNPDTTEMLTIFSHEQYQDSSLQQNIFDKTAQAFMALVPKK